MMTFVQLLLAAIVTTLTVLIGIAAIQVFQILAEFRYTLKKINKVLDNTATLSETAARPVTAMNTFFTEVKTLVNTTQDQIIEQTPDKVIVEKNSSQRFFRRGGMPLRPS